ncbi:MAG: hypothetical protein K5882_03385 [Bacteroidales bacterium]|nr:hypothetical protein [Bacteroidales bacterium]
MKKKTVAIIICCLLLIVGCLCLVLAKTGAIGKKQPTSELFAVKDTNNITKIFIADMTGLNSLLVRHDDGWYVQDSVKAMPQKMDELLSTIHNITLQQIVAKTAQSNINKMMSVNAIKVEIYQNAPKFKLFGIPFFKKERNVKTYYMGPATMDNVANFAILEGFDEPCIVHIPGFRGFLTPFFAYNPIDWYNCDLFDTKITRIQSLLVEDFEHPEESFYVEKSGTRFFNLYNIRNEQIKDYDTVKLLDMLSEYRDKNYEIYVSSMPTSTKDSIIRFNHFKTITLTDVEGKKTTLDMYRKLEPDLYYLDAIVGGTERAENEPYNRDKFYAVLNGDDSHLVQCQYFHFDRQIQPLSYFLKQQ